MSISIAMRRKMYVEELQEYLSQLLLIPKSLQVIFR
jgi:hypothetical protein